MGEWRAGGKTETVHCLCALPGQIVQKFLIRKLLFPRPELSDACHVWLYLHSHHKIFTCPRARQKPKTVRHRGRERRELLFHPRIREMPRTFVPTQMRSRCLRGWPGAHRTRIPRFGQACARLNPNLDLRHLGEVNQLREGGDEIWIFQELLLVRQSVSQGEHTRDGGQHQPMVLIDSEISRHLLLRARIR